MAGAGDEVGSAIPSVSDVTIAYLGDLNTEVTWFHAILAGLVPAAATTRATATKLISSDVKVGWYIANVAESPLADRYQGELVRKARWLLDAPEDEVEQDDLKEIPLPAQPALSYRQEG